ncbi:MAG: LPXTG cell wall anchor domain-containing protein [Candidatus Acidiferrales bacterium]
MNEFLRDWQNLLPLAGLAVLAGAGVFFAFRRKPEDQDDLERRRRAYLNRVGRIVEGHILEIAEHNPAAFNGSSKSQLSASPLSSGGPLQSKPTSLLSRRIDNNGSGSPRMLLHYTYAISGVSYETAQDITGLEERLHLARVAAGQIASVKYDPSNPSNSILLADDWSGLH